MGRRTPDYREGRSSRSPPRRKNDSSRSKDRHWDRDQKSLNEKMGAADLKKHMRQQLESASTSSGTINNIKQEIDEDLTPAQRQQRTRQIELIEEGKFRQQNFSSSYGGGGGRSIKKGQNLSKNDRLSEAEMERDKLLFGPSPQTKVTKPSQDSLDQIPMPTLTCLPKEAAVLIHPNFLLDSESRNQKWKEMWNEQRKEFGYA